MAVPACYVPVCFKKKHNARKAVWFTKATVHWSNFCIFDSRIIRMMICESTKMQKLLQCTVALVNQTALQALCFFFKQTVTPGLAHNIQAWPWSLVSILALLHDQMYLISMSSHDESLAARTVSLIPLKNNIKFRILTRS